MFFRPMRMLDEAKKAWAASGRPVDKLRFETFGSSSRHRRLPSPPISRVSARRSRVSAHETLLEALEAAGVDMIFDCRRGECGLCALPILKGRGASVDHRDVFFSEAEKAANAKLCTCVSRVYGQSITLDTADRWSPLSRLWERAGVRGIGL